MDRQEERRYVSTIFWETILILWTVNVHTECRAHLALANRVRELESQLASAKQPQADAISPSSHGGSISSPAQTLTQQAQLNNGSLVNPEGAPESTADAIATGLFDDQPGNADIGYFGETHLHVTRRVQTTKPKTDKW